MAESFLPGEAALGARRAIDHISGVTDAVQTLLAYKGAAIAVWLLLLFVLERALPSAPRPGSDGAWGWRRLARNGGLWLANIGLSPLVVLPISIWASQHALAWRPGWWSGWPGTLIDLLILDFLIYWWHRANHVFPLLWRFHEIHHLDRFLDTTSAVRFHFGEVVLSALARAGAILLLGIPIESILVFEVLVLTGALFHHSNLRLPPKVERTLARIVITPSIHWVHHHAVRADTDSNYGTFFSFWDPLFGSRSRTSRTAEMPIGVEGLGERPFPALLVRPFLVRR
ncbi:MAG: sterol desaturase family protein [Inquilinus sp.]|nr:sterol desaturase family protein [Inquilinus sp.]